MTRTTPSPAGFTLVEILVILAIIVLLAALLFPVFGRVRENARSATCASNLKQLGLAWQMYADDSDGRAMPTAISRGDNIQVWTGKLVTNDNLVGVGLLRPWLKNKQALRCPSWTLGDTPADGASADDAPSGPPADVQGYGYNAATFPRQVVARPRPLPLLSSIEKPAEMVVFADAAAVIINFTGDPPYLLDVASVASPSSGRPLFHGRHNGAGNILWADGHVKSMRPLFLDGRRKYYPIELQQQFQVGFIDRDGKATTDEFFELAPDAK